MAEVQKTKRLFVGGLYEGISSEDLKQRFSRFGNVDNMEIKVRRDDDGNHLKTFAYMNMVLSDKGFKQCLQTYNGTKWKGEVVYIQPAKESFIKRLSYERQQQQVLDEVPVRYDDAPKAPPNLKPGMSATPGTRLQDHENWVVGKYGRVLPIVHIRRRDKKKVLEVDPSKYCHGIKQLNQEAEEATVDSLTWHLEEISDLTQPAACSQTNSDSSIGCRDDQTKKLRKGKKQSGVVTKKVVKNKSCLEVTNEWPNLADSTTFIPDSVIDVKSNEMYYSGSSVDGSSVGTDILVSHTLHRNHEECLATTATTNTKQNQKKLSVTNEQSDKAGKCVHNVEDMQTSEYAKNVNESAKEDAIALFKKSIEMLQKAQELMNQQYGGNVPDCGSLLSKHGIPDTILATADENLTKDEARKSSPKGNAVASLKTESLGKHSRKKKELEKQSLSDSSDSDSPANVQLKKKALEKISAHKAMLGGSPPEESQKDETSIMKDKIEYMENGSYAPVHVKEPKLVMNDGSSDSDHPTVILQSRKKTCEASLQNQSFPSPSNMTTAGCEYSVAPMQRSIRIPSSILKQPDGYYSSSEGEIIEKCCNKPVPCGPKSSRSHSLGGLTSLGISSISEFSDGYDASLISRLTVHNSDQDEDLLDIVASGNQAALKRMVHKAEKEAKMKEKLFTTQTVSHTAVNQIECKQKSSETESSSCSSRQLKGTAKSDGKALNKRKKDLNAENEDSVNKEKNVAKKMKKIQEIAVEDCDNTTSKLECKANERAKNPNKVQKHEQSNLRRLESLKERKLENVSQQKAIKDALSKVDSSKRSYNKVVFASDEDDDVVDSGGVGEASRWAVLEADFGQHGTVQNGPVLFDSDSMSADEAAEANNIFRIRPEKEGQEGAKLMKLQSRYGNDDRFKLTAAFMESQASDLKETNDNGEMNNAAEEWNISEREQSLQILQQVMGNKALNKTQPKNRFRDVGNLRYDPSQEQHEKFEIQQVKSIKESNCPKGMKFKAISATDDNRSEPEPQVSKERFSEMASDLKTTFQSTTTPGETFSFSALFTGNQTNQGASAETSAVAVPVTAATSLMQDQFCNDSSSAEEDALETHTLPNQPFVADAQKEGNPLFFSENDSRILESVAAFSRHYSLEELRCRWKSQQPEVLESVRLQRKRALRNSHQSRHPQRSHPQYGRPAKRLQKHR